ncbi:MAG TPA: tetratricopeptide repeat protein [Pyrinomonadaceae bacterium]|nr:tetratricopeptide repeat protein [Pyrinomonadaceae bacterium]
MLYAGRIAAFLTILMLSFSVASGQGSNSLQGRVIAPDGNQPLAPVRVTLTYNGRRIYETFTDLSGRFSFSGLSKGTYQLTAEGDGRSFVTTTVYAELSTFGNAPQLFTQDVQLRPPPGNQMQPKAVLNAFSQDVPKSATENLRRAQKLAGEGKRDLAMAQLQEAVKTFPQYFEAHLMIGNQLLEAGRLDEAIAALDRAREINSNDERIYQSFGLLLMKQKKYQVAVAIFAEAARLNPTNPLNPLMKASALIYQASYIEGSSQRKVLLAEAELALNRTSELSDKKVKADAMTLAMFYEMKDEPARAADELENYLRKNPTAQNFEAVKTEITRLRSKAASKFSP